MKRPTLTLRNNAEPLVMEATSLYALAALLMLVQLPHVLNLPIWISVFGVAMITLRVYARRTPHDVKWRYLFSTPSITLLAVIGAALIRAHYGYFLGRDPCVAFLFILVSLKFAEYRRSADATLLLGLSCILLLTQYFYSQSLIAALVTLPAVLALGHALAVLRDPTHALAKKPQLRLIGKLLLQGLPIALMLFVMFPRLPGPLWSLPDDASGKTGLSDTMRPGDIGSLSQSNEVAFRVEFEGAPPPADARYWRGPVLTRFDGFTWSPEPRLVEAYPGSTVPSALEYTVMLQPHKQNWLFALDQAVSIPSKDGSITPIGSVSDFATLSTAGQLMSRDPVTRVLRYTQRSAITGHFQAPVKPSQVELNVPNNIPRTTTLAKKLRAQSSSANDYVNRVLNRFNQMDYRYTLEPGLLGNNPVDEFLFDSRQGFCEHYASAFTMMMRAAGLPARVVTGYLGGEMNEDYMIVRQSDAHAWSEVYINGVWQRFDPTAAVAPERVENGLRAALPDGEFNNGFANSNAFSWTKKAGLMWDAVNHDWQRMVVDYNNRSQENLFKKIGLPSFALWQLTAFILAISAVWCLWMLRSPLRKKPPLLPAERIWKKLETVLQSQGIEREPAETPQAYLERAYQTLGRGNEELQRIGQTLMSARFAPMTGKDAEAQAGQADAQLGQLRKTLQS